jgi:hypothetical protein
MAKFCNALYGGLHLLKNFESSCKFEKINPAICEVSAMRSKYPSKINFFSSIRKIYKIGIATRIK